MDTKVAGPIVGNSIPKAVTSVVRDPKIANI